VPLSRQEGHITVRLFNCGPTLVHTFSTRANPTVGGNYSFDAAVPHVGDPNPANNAYTGYVVTNSPASALA
jgi:hypothetical protein